MSHKSYYKTFDKKIKIRAYWIDGKRRVIRTVAYKHW